MPTTTKKLLIVESPAKAKTISKYLDGEYTVRASVGHIRDLPKSNKNAIDIDAGFVPRYEISKGKEKVVNELKSLARHADEVILATDPDREGEAIAWHLAEAIGLKKPQRIVFHEITKEAVQEAMNHPRQIDDNLKTAQEARRVLDRLFGYDLSGLIWRKLRYGLSAGRVQSPALRILVEREREIRVFIPEKYWVIDANFSTTANTKIPFVCSVEPKSEKEASEIVASGQSSKWQIADIKQSGMNRKARAPFTTSTLQQYASSRLGYSPSVTMRLAQKLYEAGHISYMRTDSTNLSGQALGEIESVVKEKYGANYYARQTYTTKSKNAQEAHEAIRPTHATIMSVGHTPQEQKLYRLIWSRAVASQMADAKFLKTKIIAETKTDLDTSCPSGHEVSKSDKPVVLPPFFANGSVITFDGWLKADPEARGEENVLPKVTTGDQLKLEDITSTGKETQPPPRYSEAGLVKELEKRGIGRPSTYAPTIKTIIDRGYVEKEQRSLKPTDTGEVVSEFLEKYFAGYISDDFTREMEDKLDLIAEGKEDYVKMLKDFYGPFKNDVASKKKLEKITNLGDAPADMKCPVCDGPMIIKLGKNGKFLSCAKFPDCTGARTIDGKEMEGPKLLENKCPKCGHQLMEREGRFGKFIACSNYPKCKYIKKDESDGQGGPGDSGVECPLCHQGTMIEKRGRFGNFYGCSHYPKCKHIIKTKPTGKICGYPRETGPCIHLMMAGTKTIPERCSDKTCPNHNPHKLTKTK